MRKQTKLVAVLSATALLAIGASAAAFAAGWDNSTGEWQWIGNDGVAVSNEWKKSGNDWFYLGDDGNMVIDSVIDDDGDYYYVNEAGAMISNTWKSVDSDDGEAEYNWYYFGNDGKAYTNDSGEIKKSKIKTINGKKYTFDDEGKMLYGWLDETSTSTNDDDGAWKTAQYYFGDWNDGAAASGWQQLTVDDDGDTETYWFYFDSNGKKKTGEQTIDGKKYYLDDNDGHMLDEWADASSSVAPNGDNSIATTNVVYLNGDGSRRTNTWIWAVPSAEYNKDDNDDDEYSWFYAKANGRLEIDTIRKINGKSYAFDSLGRMQTGLVAANAGKTQITKKYDGTKFTDMTGNAYANLDLEGQDVYYFSGSESDGAQKKGYQNVEFDDDTFQMYFNTSSGKAENNYVSKIKKYVANGVVLKANSDNSNYAGVAVKSDKETLESANLKYFDAGYGAADGKSAEYILVNTAGSIQKSKTNLKDANDLYYLTDSDGYVKFVSDKKLTTTKSSKNNVEAVKVGNKQYYYVED